jgi:uncharacterized UBP type Zn finger protein
MALKKKTCEHLRGLGNPKLPKALVCEQCVETGSRWVHLRTCQTCGITLCCDSSPHKHASKHYEETDHPVIRSAEPGENWLYCYPHQLFMS